MNYKLICIDMDGTLLSDKHEVPDINKEMIKRATEKGVKIAITTGRIFTSAKKYSGIIGVDAPIIASNGAYIREKDKDDVIYESNLSKEQFDKILSVIEKHGLTVYFNTSDTMITADQIPEDHAYKVMNNSLAKEDRVKILENINLREVFEEFDGKILKGICIEENDKELLAKAKAEMQKHEDLEVVSSWDNNFEIMPKGTSKGEAVKRLAQMLGIKREEIICIGDSENDLSMIKYAGLGIAMGNAMDIIKENAQYITDTNTNGGVGKAIEKFVL